MSKRQFVEFNNRKFYLSPENGYYEAKIKKDNKRHTLRLQRAVWEFYNGSIPEGYQIHHIDGNKQNNNISNLQLLSHQEHAKLHSQQKGKEIWNRKEMKEANARGREKCKEWHKSENGKKWHSEHQKETIKKNVIEKICTDCGAKFKTWHDKREQTLCRKCRDKYLHREIRRRKREIQGV